MCTLFFNKGFSTEESVKTPTDLHICCDVCATVCTCADCQIFADSAIDLSRAHEQMPSQTCELFANPIIQTEIKKQLLSYRNVLFIKIHLKLHYLGTRYALD